MKLIPPLLEAGKHRRQRLNEFISLGDQKRDLQLWKESASAYRDALAIDDSLARIWVQLGHALKEDGQLQEAEEAYSRSLSLSATADSHLQLGHLHKMMGRMRLAEEDYLAAFRLQPWFRNAQNELANMGWSLSKLQKLVSSSGNDEVEAATALCISVELSDLIDHLERVRYPTGIQRVQLCLAQAFIAGAEGIIVQFVYYEHVSSQFYEVHPSQVLDIIDAVENLTRSDEARQQIIARTKAAVSEAPPVEFVKGSYLVNVGTSWGFLNYFQTLREARRIYGVRYVPLVHDCIPLLFPEFCNPHLVRDFLNWISLMVDEADLVLCNSDNTRHDFEIIASQLSVSMPKTSVIRLNGEYGERKGEEHTRDLYVDETLRLHNLDVGGYVLFVSTIEPRKNHMFVLNAWSNMIKQSAKSAPRLVCVGGAGWMNDDFHDRLRRDRALGSVVIVLRDVTDQLLQRLYQNCLFTVFPSLYEGWGLPISEALAYGKVPLVSNVSSHPEAGGSLAVYFDPGSAKDFQDKLRELIENSEMRRERELAIATARPLRPWREIAQDVLNSIRALPGRVHENVTDAPVIEFGRYYRFGRNLAKRLDDICFSADAFRSRGWHSPEDWGCWVRDRLGVISFQLPQESMGEVMIYLHLAATPHMAAEVTIALPGSPETWSSQRGPNEHWWEPILLRTEREGQKITLRLSGQNVVDLAAYSDGSDSRRTSMGVVGIYVCPAKDVKMREALVESIVLGNLTPLARRFGKVVSLTH